MFDKRDFCPCFKGLPIKALELAKQHLTIKDENSKTIFHAKNLFCIIKRTMD